ncbi:hypothetical protein IFM89_004313 [Coptis chinensis]|uniref:Ionotropic glutamate receptor C-terminal domain-containing protein n=1 Tax=Coptis chinensis TaxID=261450 RepID=A0A835IAR7_9MAGN|nr:hypothetical protein IFM89_004313 [Coptis chinensis]
MTKTRPQRPTIVFLFYYFLRYCCIWTAALRGGTTIPPSFHVGVILDLGTSVGKISDSCMSMAVSDFYATNDHYESRLVLHPKDSKDVVSAVFSAVELLDDVNVQVLVGPQRSMEAEFVAELGNKYQVPVVSFSATSPSISSSQIPYFVRMTQSDTSQLKAIASIISSFGWKEVIFISEESDYGNGIVPYLIDIFQASNISVPYRSVVPLLATEDQILEKLRNLLTMQTRVFLVHMSSALGANFFLKVNEVGLMSEGNVWIITDGLTDLLGSMDYSVIESMQGVLGLKPYIPRSRKLNKFRVKMIRKIAHESSTLDDVNIFCLRAYDTVWALAKAAERVGTNHSFREPIKLENSSHLPELRKSEIGPELLKEIVRSKFKGLSGEIHLVEGQLQPQIFQIINVFSEGGREVGFWIPTVGLSPRSDVTTRKIHTRTQANLRPIIWPGESTMVPKGWLIPTNGGKLMIGYPVKESFSEFVRVDLDSNNVTVVTGYCIDVFKEVMEALPYDVPYEFVPFEKAKDERGGGYDNLVYQVYLQKYDAVVGDVTITANRSLWVDFSLPYTIGGVAMLIPVKYEKRNIVFIMYELFAKSVWLSSFAMFLFTAIVIWCFEDLRSSDVSFLDKIAKIPAIAWNLLLSLTVNQSSFKEMKNVSKFIVFVVTVAFIFLGQLFLQSLVQGLTNETQQLSVVDAKDLIQNGDLVGYRNGSFVEMVLKKLNFDESQLKAYNSPQEYEEALDKGSKNGGVAAIFEEIPYITLLIKKYCRKYRRVGPIYRMEGFGFAFPRGSPLVSDVSRAVLSVVEGEKITKIETKWLGSESNCPYPAKKTFYTLSFEEIGGVFVIVLLVIVSGIVVFMLSDLRNKFWLLKRKLEIDQNPPTPEEPAVQALPQFVHGEENEHYIQMVIHNAKNNEDVIVQPVAQIAPYVGLLEDAQGQIGQENQALHGGGPDIVVQQTKEVIQIEESVGSIIMSNPNTGKGVSVSSTGDSSNLKYKNVVKVTVPQQSPTGR